MSRPVSGSWPRTLPSSADCSSSSRALAGVISSGATSSLIVARRGVVEASSVISPVDTLRHGLLDVRPVAPDAHDDALADRDGRDLPGVDLPEVLDELLEAEVR